MNSSTALAAFIAHCRKVTHRQQMADAELLRRFVEQRENAAFEELIARYASLVWGVCRRIVSSEADCEDAFQAVFLILFRQAGEVDPERPLGAWLHGVAVRAAHRAAAHSARQPTLATLPEQATPGDIADELGNRELFRVVDEEIARLPALLREPFVLCCLEGRTRDEAAAALHCSIAAIKSRLERSRNLLRKRLERRGIGLPAALLVVGLTGGHVQASLRAKALQCVCGSVSSAVAALVPAASMSITSKLALTAMSLVMVGFLSFGAYHVIQTEPSEVPAKAKDAASQSPSAEKPQPRVDRFGDPLPPGAIRRFGTLRFRHPEIAGLAFTPDGKRLIAGSGRRSLSVFDAVTGQRLREVGKASANNMGGFALSPDGKRVACCGFDVFVWDLDTGRLVRECKCGRCQAVAFSPDGKEIAAVKELSAEVVLVEVATGKHLGEWTIKQGQPLQFHFGSLTFSQDGKFLAGILSEWREDNKGFYNYRVVSSQIYLLDAATGKVVRTFGSPNEPISSCAFQPGTGRLAAACKDRVLRFWDVKTGEEMHHLPARKEMSYVPRFTADGQRCIALNKEGSALAVVDTRDGREIRKIDTHAHPSVIALSPDGRVVAGFAGLELFGRNRVYVWDIESGAERLADAGHNGPPTLSLSADGRTLISQSERVFHWDLRTGEGRPQPGAVKKVDDRISWSLELGYVAYRGRNWRLRTDIRKLELEVRTMDSSRLLRKINDPTVANGRFALSPDGTHVAFASRKTVFLWDPEKEEKPHELPGQPPDHCQELLFSHDGKRLIAGADTHNKYPSSTLWIWDVATARLVRKLDTNSAAGHMLLTADDHILLTGGRWSDATVHAWDMETGKELACLADPSLKHTSDRAPHGSLPPAIHGLALSADERFLAVVSSWEDNTSVSVWDTGSWKLIRAFSPTQPQYSSNSIVFSRDGRSLFVANSDTTILEWDVSGRFGHNTETPNEDRLNTLWRKVAKTPDQAYPAVWELLDNADKSVPFLIGKLLPVKPVEEKRVRQLLSRLDSESFAEREQTSRELLALGEQALPLLREALNNGPSLEAKKRIEGLMESLRGVPTSDQLRLLRALAVLEWSKRPNAVEHLRKLADGAPSASLTRAAKAAWQRWGEKSLGRSLPVKEK